MPLRIPRREIRARRFRRHDVAPWRHDIRLQHEVVPRRTLRAVRRQRVVRPLRRLVRVHRPNRQRIRAVARRRDAAIHRFPVHRAPEIAGRGDDRDPRLHCALHRLAHRIVAIGLQHRRAQRQVDHANLVLMLVRNRPVDRLNHIARHARPIVPQHAEVHELRARRDAPIRLRLGEHAALAGHDARHVRAVPEAVHAVAADEVPGRDDAVLQERAMAGVDP